MDQVMEPASARPRREQRDYQRAYRSKCRARGRRDLDVVIRREAGIVLARLSLMSGLTEHEVVAALLGDAKAPGMVAQTYG